MARKASGRTTVDDLLADTGRLVTRLLAENRLLKARNQKLTAELERVSKGWELIKKLARSAPRRRR